MGDFHTQPGSEHTPTPWRANTASYDIYADNVPKGPMKVADIRGWGYLTGKGHGALGLSYEEASQIQQANALLIVEAVNSHAALKSRVEELTKALQQIAGLGEDDDDPEYEIARRALAVSLEQEKSHG